MRRFTRYLFIVLLAAACCLAFVSCKDEPEHEHKPVSDVDAKAATCTENGNIKYYKCECGKLFKDISCQTEITEEDTVIPALGHDFKAAWLTVAGKTCYCKTCQHEGCSEVQEQPVAMGSTGPAGGYVFYDCDADNASGNVDGLTSETCGWRYLEAAPADIMVDSTNTFVFGYYRTTPDGSNQYVNGAAYAAGTADADDGKSTGTAIGTGKANTAKLVAAKETAAYTRDTGAETTADYAAKLCADYTLNGFDDWFLPSKDESNKMYDVLKAECGVGSFANDYYWSSSEYIGGAGSAWIVKFDTCTISSSSDGAHYRVRAIRAF